MFSVKKNILQTVALLKSYEVQHIVLSPGSRNAPLMQTFSQDPYFQCHVIVDERNAAFYALGLIQELQKTVAICCTSGTALLNYAPAVAEAFYQELPLVVISADRTQEWIGQMDGQIIIQAGALNNFVKKSVGLPEIKDSTDEWYCNRLINEAMIACTKDVAGPVHINIPIGEPLFDYSQDDLPDVRKISFIQSKKQICIKPFIEQWKHLPKRMIIVGQLFKSEKITTLLETLAQKCDCIIVTEHISNSVSPYFISNFDALLYKLSEEERENYLPDLVITLGGHIISKRLKQLLRTHKPKKHWHISQSGEVVDLFQALTDLIDTSVEDFLSYLLPSVSQDMTKSFSDIWKKESAELPEPSPNIPFCDIFAIGDFLKVLPKGSALHLANSSAVRNAQLYAIDKSVNIYCNRGTNGIESSLPSAVGFASIHDGLTYLIIGDLSFFYGLNSLWNIEHIKNLRILLINNEGGGIFHLIPGLNKSSSLDKYVSAEHETKAKNWAIAAGLQYLSADNKEEFSEVMKIFVSDETKQSILLEVSTDMETSKKTFQAYYHSLKN